METEKERRPKKERSNDGEGGKEKEENIHEEVESLKRRGDGE